MKKIIIFILLGIGGCAGSGADETNINCSANSAPVNVPCSRIDDVEGEINEVDQVFVGGQCVYSVTGCNINITGDTNTQETSDNSNNSDNSTN